ncbi:hypothetical protein ACVGOW_27595 [Pseudonocardia saturnea]
MGSSLEAANFAEMGMLLRRIDVTARAVAESGSGYDKTALLHGFPGWSKVIYGWGLDTRDTYHYSGRSLIRDEIRNTLASTHNILSAAAREGVFPASSRDQLLDHAQHVVTALVGEIGNDQHLPEVARVKLIERLVDVQESLRMVHFRGDEAVVLSLQRSEIGIQGNDSSCNRNQRSK